MPAFVLRLLSAMFKDSLKTLKSLMSSLNSVLTWGLTLVFATAIWFGSITTASADTVPADELFQVNCAGCHPNGANIIRRGKSLKQKALKRYGYESKAAIATLITNGKGLMSAYGDQLSEDEIASLANYVLERAASNWKAAE